LDELHRLQAESATATEELKAGVDHRLALVSATLASVRVVEPVHDGKVRFGSTVTLRWEDGREQTLSFVGPDEADAKAGRVSIDSPLGRSLLERSAGDTVGIERPRGVEEATLVSVS
jgi:transcription elongation factor GreB